MATKKLRKTCILLETEIR